MKNPDAKQMSLDFNTAPTLKLPDPGEISLAAAQAPFKEALFADGADCPCCGKFAKVYVRRANSSMMLCLWALSRASVREPSVEWHHVQAIDAALAFRKKPLHWSSGWGAGLAKWGLVEEKPGQGENSRTSGYWKMAQIGKDFLAGTAIIPREIHIYANETIGFSGERVSFEDALSEKFDYRKLMSLTPFDSLPETVSLPKKKADEKTE